MNNIENIKRYLSTSDISFLIDFNKTIDIDKSNKYKYFKLFYIDLDGITNFIDNLKNNEICLIQPLISVNCRYNDPYLTLSRQFLVSNNSNPKLIKDYLMGQLEIAKIDFGFDESNLFLIFKYKLVNFDYKYMAS